MYRNQGTIQRRGASQSATFVVAAADSLHQGLADYVCDGVDDQVEIQAAIDALSTGGGKVALLDGTYNISDSINVPTNGVMLEGCGAGTIISTSSYILAPIYITGNFVTINNFKLKKNQGNVSHPHGFGIDIHSADDVTISNIILEGTELAASPWEASPTWGIHGQYCNRLKYLGNHVSNTEYEGLTLWEGCTGCVFANNVVDHCGFGLVFEKEGTWGNTMVGNTVNNSQKGECWDILLRSTYGNTVTGNIIQNRGTANTPGYAIRVDGLSYDNTIVNNVITDAAGIHLDNFTFNNLVQGNVLRKILTDGTITKAAIYVQGKGNIIESNIINYFEDHGIFVHVAPHTQIVNNRIMYGGDGGSYGIWIDGSLDCDISENIVVGTDHTGIIVFADDWHDVSGSYVNNNIIEDPNEVNTTLYADASAGSTEIQVQYIENIHLGQYISVGGEEVRIINIFSYQDNGSPAVLTISPALSNNHSAGTSIIDVPKQTVGLRCDGTGTISPVYAYNNIVRDATTPVLGTSNFMLRNNIGFTTENSGTATLANGTTSIAVNHGLDVTPSAGDIVVTPIEDWGNMTKFWIGNYTSTQFTIYADQDPGQDVDFAWKAIVL